MKFIYITGIVLIFMLFLLAVNNLDNAYNLKTTELTFGVDGCDSNIFGYCYSSDSLYMMSTNMIIGLFLVVTILLLWVVGRTEWE